MRTNNKGDLVFFDANDYTHGYEPWVTDGTPAGTRMIRDVNPGGFSSSAFNWQPIGDSKTTKMIFAANDGVSGRELWITDGTPANTKQIKDIWPGPSTGTDLFFSVADNGTLYFRANDGVKGFEIWKTDGTPAGTRQVFDVNPAGHGNFYEPVVSGGKIYFTARSSREDYELWVHDPATNATRLVKDLLPGTEGSHPSSLAATRTGKVFFSAMSSKSAGYELHVTDGTAAGTRMVKDLYPGGNSLPELIAESVPSRVVFKARDAKHGHELWVSDGTSAGTVRLPIAKSPPPTTDSAGIYGIVEMNGKVYFAAYDGPHGQELWSSDGTAAGTQLVKDLDPGVGPGDLGYHARLGNRIFFCGNTNATGAELFVSDGTAAGTKRLVDVVSSSAPASRAGSCAARPPSQAPARRNAPGRRCSANTATWPPRSRIDAAPDTWGSRSMPAALDGRRVDVRISQLCPDRLERLVRYVARGPICNDRLELDGDGMVVYRFKREWKNGVAAVPDRGRQAWIHTRDAGELLGGEAIGLVVALVDQSQVAGIRDEHVMARLLQQLGDPQRMRACFERDPRGSDAYEPLPERVRRRTQPSLLDDLAVAVADAEVAEAVAEIDADGQRGQGRGSVSHGRPPLSL